MNKPAIATILAAASLGFLKSIRGSQSQSNNIEIHMSGSNPKGVDELEKLLRNLQPNEEKTISLKLFNVNFHWSDMQMLMNILPTIPRLTKVEIHGCGIWIDEILPALCGCKTIKHLTIDRSEVTEIPECIGNLTNLESLRMSHNWNYYYNQENPGYTVDIPSSIGNLVKLKEIVIHESATGNIPPEIGNLTNLEHLKITNGNVKELPNEIGNLSNLKILNLSGNKIHRLNPAVCNLSGLEELNLSNNREIRKHPLKDLSLDLLPDDIGNLTNLKKIDLNRLSLKSLPESMNNLTKLEELNMDYPSPEMYTLPHRLFGINKLYIIGIGSRYPNASIKLTEEGFNKLIQDGYGRKAIEIANKYRIHPKIRTQLRRL